jgi:hypothetical protein
LITRIMRIPPRSAGWLLAAAAAACNVQVDKGGRLSVDLARGKATEQWRRTYALPPGGTLDIVNVDGPIEAGPAHEPQVEIVVRREAEAPSDQDAQQLLQKARIVEDVAPERVRIEAGGGRRGGDRRGRIFGSSHLETRFEVRVPAGLTVSLKTENGAIQVGGFKGWLTATATNGGITGRGLQAATRVSTVNGSVHLAFDAIGGEVEATTVNGSIRIELPADAGGALRATTVNGSVTVDERLPLRVLERERLHVAGTLNDGGPAITLRTTNGSIRVMVRD